jgi:hypothetical protein
MQYKLRRLKQQECIKGFDIFSLKKYQNNKKGGAK